MSVQGLELVALHDDHIVCAHVTHVVRHVRRTQRFLSEHPRSHCCTFVDDERGKLRCSVTVPDDDNMLTRVSLALIRGSIFVREKCCIRKEVLVNLEFILMDRLQL